MPLPVIADTYRMALKWTGPGGANAINVLHFRRAGTTSAAVAAAMDANVTQTMWQTITTAWSVTALYVTPLDGVSATYILATSGAKWTGPAAGDYVPQASAITSLRTLLRGPANRGRIYLPGCAEGGQTNGVRTAGDVTAAQTAFNTWLAAMIAGTTLPVVASYKHLTAPAVTSVLCEPLLGTQRRRMSRLR